MLMYVKKGQLMSNIKNAIEKIVNCSDCYGQGFTGWVSPDGDFDYDFCDCNPNSISADEIEAHKNQLFAGSEAN
jgi:hypothetical protein